MRFKAPIAEDIFLHTFSICTDHVRWLSICNPKDLVECILLTSQSSILMSMLSWEALTLCRDPIIVNSVLVIFRLSLFVISQSLHGQKFQTCARS